MRRLRNEKGGTFGCALFLLLVLAAGYAAYQFFLPYSHYSTVESHIAEMMPYYKYQGEDFIRKAVIDAVKEYDLELKPEQVKVVVDKKANRLTIDMEWTRDVVFPYYTYTYHFKPHLTGQTY